MPENCSDPANIKKVALAILSYFRLHPHAKDTVDGIARWWVGEKKIAVKEALDLLMKDGVVKEAQGHYFYCGNPQVVRQGRRNSGGIGITDVASRHNC